MTATTFTDGFREADLREIGIDGTVEWRSDDRVVVTMRTPDFDALVDQRQGNAGLPLHDDCHDDRDVEDARVEAREEGYSDGYAKALDDIAKLAESAA